MSENDQSGSSQGENTPESQEGKQSRSIESVTAEFARKTERLQQENAAMNQKLEKMLNYLESQRLNSQTSSNQGNNDENLEDLAYTNPKLYAQKVKEMAKKEALNAVNSTFAEQQKTNTVLTQLAAEYPELADNNSELTKKAVEIYKNMSETERTSPIAYKVAVRDAAADLGVLPKGKRSTSEPNISSSSVANNLSSKTPQKGKVDEKTLEIAQLMGLDVTDKKVLENLNKRSQRKNWGRYE